MSTATRPKPQQTYVLELLTRQIRDGTLQPGQRLPTRPELADRLGVSLVTVQRALERLAKDQLVVARGRAGTFVSERPPHLFHLGVVYPKQPEGSEHWSAFHHALDRESRRLSQESHFTLGAYYGLESPQALSAYQRLVADIEAGKFAGLVFPHSPHAYRGTPIREANVPRVTTMRHAWPDCGAIRFDGRRYFDLVPECVRQAGRSRLAVLSHGVSLNTWVEAEHFERSLEQHGVICPSRWQMPVPFPYMQCAEPWLEMLFHGSERPDVLLVADDNFVPVASRTLKRLGVRVPEECLLIAHANFPHPTECVLPAIRVGYRIDTLMEIAVEEIESQRQGHAPACHVIGPYLSD